MLPEAFPPLPLDLVQREGWGGSLWSRELTSVSSVHSWTGETGVALVRGLLLLFMSDWLSLLISLRLTR